MSRKGRRLVAAGVLAIFATLATKGRTETSVPLSLTDAAKMDALRSEITGNGRDQLRILIRNASTSPAQITLPAGLILRGINGDRIIVLRQTEIAMERTGTTEAEIPVAALSSRNTLGIQHFAATVDSEPILTGFLKFLATHNDIPRTTSQLVVLTLLENISYSQWQQFTGTQGDPAKKPANDVVQAIDVLGLLKDLAPGKTFALAQDNELKLRALRNPVSRVKAVQVYGLDFPETSGVPPAEAPNLKQLLHTQPGDNCPVCRMRQQSQRGAADF